MCLILVDQSVCICCRIFKYFLAVLLCVCVVLANFLNVSLLSLLGGCVFWWAKYMVIFDHTRLLMSCCVHIHDSEGILVTGPFDVAMCCPLLRKICITIKL